MKNDPNKNGMTYATHTLPSLHLFTFLKLFYNMAVGTCINFIHRWCVLPMGVGSKLPQGGSPVKACVG